MLVLNEQGTVAQTIREVEQILRDKGISISHRGDGLLITVSRDDGKEVTCVILDAESKDIQQVFPTEVEPTFIQRIENYISGA